MKKVIKFKNQEIEVKKSGDRLSWQSINSILHAVGLEIYLSESGEFMDDFWRGRFGEITAWVEEWTDMDSEEAKLRLTRFMLIYGMAGVNTSITQEEKRFAWVDWIKNLSAYVFDTDEAFKYKDLHDLILENEISSDMFGEPIRQKVHWYREKIVKAILSQ